MHRNRKKHAPKRLSLYQSRKNKMCVTELIVCCAFVEVDNAGSRVDIVTTDSRCCFRTSANCSRQGVGVFNVLHCFYYLFLIIFCLIYMTVI